MPKTTEDWIPKEHRAELTCKECNQLLPRDQFQARGMSKSGLRLFSARCKICDGKHVRKNHVSYVTSKIKHKVVRQETILHLKQACIVCGYSRCKTALEFHHLNETTKDAEISDMVAKGKGLKWIMEEIKKCVVLCANCHREYHAGLLDLGPYINVEQAL